MQLTNATTDIEIINAGKQNRSSKIKRKKN